MPRTAPLLPIARFTAAGLLTVGLPTAGLPAPPAASPQQEDAGPVITEDLLAGLKLRGIGPAARSAGSPMWR